MKPHIRGNSRRTAFLLFILIGSLVPLSLSLSSPMMISSSGSVNNPVPEDVIVFKDGFESGDFSAWTGVATTGGDSATIVTANSYDGRYHGRFQTGPIVSGVKYAYYYKTLSPAPSEVYARAYFYIVDGLPLDDNNDRFGLIGFEVEGGLTATFRVYRSGIDRFNIVGLDGTGTVQKSTDAVYPVEGRWYCLEFYIRVHSTMGEYRAWINGVERISIINLNTTRYGAGVSRVRFGLTYTADVQHYVEAYVDSVVISTSYVGQLRYTFGVIGSVKEIPAIRNFYWLFGNQSIRYRVLLPSEVTNFADVDSFDGLVVWTKQGFNYNVSAIKKFAQTRTVIPHIWDFSNMLYPSLSGSTQIVATNTVTYVRDWGNFRKNDLVEMRNETGNSNQLTTVLASSLAKFSNVTHIAQYDSSRIVFFHMNGTHPKSGFYVMDLDATTPETEWTGIWHLFPAIKTVKDFPTGKYARWFANGIQWPSIDWINTWMENFAEANSRIVRMASIGTSVQGRPINAFFIGKGARYDIIDAAMHGFEKAPVFAVLRLAELIVEDYNAGGYWSKRLQEYTIIIIPVLNPDGYNANTYNNANDKDLNRQFPPGTTTTEPEAWALKWLMGNYTPAVYVNNHEGRHWYPLDIIYGKLETDPQLSFTLDAIHWANVTFSKLKHWGYYTDKGCNIWIGNMRKIWRGGSDSTPIAYTSWKYNASTLLTETFVWSSSYEGINYQARQGLWAIDYYVSVNLGFIMHLDKLIDEHFIVHSDAKIESMAWTTQLSLEIDTSELTSPSLTKIYVGYRGKPATVKIDEVNKIEDKGWTYSDGIITIVEAKNTIEIHW